MSAHAGNRRAIQQAHLNLEYLEPRWLLSAAGLAGSLTGQLLPTLSELSDDVSELTANGPIELVSDVVNTVTDEVDDFIEESSAALISLAGTIDDVTQVALPAVSGVVNSIAPLLPIANVPLQPTPPPPPPAPPPTNLIGDLFGFLNARATPIVPAVDEKIESKTETPVTPPPVPAPPPTPPPDNADIPQPDQMIPPVPLNGLPVIENNRLLPQESNETIDAQRTDRVAIATNVSSAMDPDTAENPAQTRLGMVTSAVGLSMAAASLNLPRGHRRNGS